MPRKGPSANVEVVDWGAEGETRMLTVHALELLRTAASA
jgi:hypothetical protein